MIQVATLISVEILAPGSSTAISIVVLCGVLPEVCFANVEGILADSFDRRKLVAMIDFAAGIVVLLFLVASYYQNLSLFYFSIIARSTCQALLHPVNRCVVFKDE